MTVLIDTARLPVRERAEAVQAALHSSESPQQATWIDGQPGRFRTETVEVGPAVHMLRTTSDAVRILRTARHVRQYAPDAFAIGFQTSGHARLTAGGVHDIDLPTGSLMCVDSSSPYDYAQSGGLNRHESVIVGYQEMGLSVGTVHAAAPALTRSPVYGLVRGHIAHLFEATDTMPEGVRDVTGQATVALIRALVTTAALARGHKDALEDVLEVRIACYIDAYYKDRDLSPERIARVHHISMRHLYNVWARAGHPPLAQAIIDRRLQYAQRQLDAPGRRHVTIAAIAREAGFANLSHFSRRFRDSFGMTPSEWRTAAVLA